MQNYVFIVHCERVRRTSSYYLRFLPNDQLQDRIKKLPHETRTWHPSKLLWEVKAYSLFLLIKKYRNSTKIHFDFGSNESRNIFISQIKKLEEKESEKRKFIAELNVKKEQWVKFKQELEKNYLKYSDDLHKFLNEGIKLYPHQIMAAMYTNVTRNVLISHEMGTGKSLSSIVYAEMNGFKKVVVITPNSLKFNYYNEVKKFTKSTAYVINWKKNTCTIEDAKYVIFNYEYFNSSNAKLKDESKRKRKKFDDKWAEIKDDIGLIDCVIADESHRLKNTKSNTYKNYKRIFTSKIFRDKKISKVYLSGTPAPNRAYELYTILNQISPVDFPTKRYFYEYYCGMVYDQENGYGWENNGESKLEELYHRIAPFTHRKRKSEVLTNLPDKIYQKIMLEMSDSEYTEYSKIEGDTVDELEIHRYSNPLTIMLRLRQYVSQLKVKHVLDLVNNIIDTGEKIVIVDVFKDSLYLLKEKLGDIAALHTGDQSVEERAEIVQRFQDPNSNLKIFLGSIQTCNYGLTLTAANKLFILSLPFVPGEYDQVADRLHRIGQKNVVNIYPLMFYDTIDDYVYSAIESKRVEIMKVIDNEDYTSDITESVMSDVIEMIKKKHGRSI